jgi:hypothetical protein
VGLDVGFDNGLARGVGHYPDTSPYKIATYINKICPSITAKMCPATALPPLQLPTTHAAANCAVTM